MVSEMLVEKVGQVGKVSYKSRLIESGSGCLVFDKLK
jgi:hypothetical protein